MATTFIDYTGDGNNNKTFTFPSYQKSDVKVEVDNVVKTPSTHYNITNYTTTGGGTVEFTSGNIPASEALIRIYRDTDISTTSGEYDPKATFQAGSSVRSVDLNNNQKQALYAIAEEKDQNITAADIKDGIITSAKIADGTIATIDLADNSVTAPKIAADAVGSAQIADNAVTSSELASDSVGTTQIKDNAVTSAKIAGNAVGSAQIADGAVGASEIAANAVGSAQIADGAVGSSELAADSVGSAQIADGAVGSSEIAADAVGSAQIADGAVGASEIAANAVGSAQIADDAVGNSEIAADAVQNAQLADNSVAAANIAANAVGSAQIADGAIGSSELASDSVGNTQLKDNAVTMAEIGCEETTITDDDTKVPTSGAVVDYVSTQISNVGGLKVIATEVAFPTTANQPASGVVISIADAGGIVFNGSGVSTTGRTTDGTPATVTISGAPSSLYSETIAAGVGMQVSSTGSGNNYTYHKILSAESDVKQLSDDINDFNSRYRIASSAPGSNNDEGDLYFDTSANKMYVYDGSAWGQVTSTGEFKILGVKDNGQAHNGTGPTFNGSNDQYDLFEGTSDANITTASQLLVVLNGVLQKPNDSYDAAGEGFALDGVDGIRFCDPPPTGSTLYVTKLGSATDIGVPADNTVSAGKTDISLVQGDIIYSNGTDSWTRLAKGTAGQVLKINSGATAPEWGTAVGGATGVNFNDSVIASWGTGADLKIKHDGTNSYIYDDGVGSLFIRGTNSILLQSNAGEHYFIGTADGAAELYHDNTKKLETTAAGVDITGGITTTTSSIFVGDVTFDNGTNAGKDITWDESDDALEFADDTKIVLGTGGDFKISFNSSNAIFANDSSNTGGDVYFQTDDIYFMNVAANETMAAFKSDGACELYYDNTKEFETKAGGVTLNGCSNSVINHSTNVTGSTTLDFSLADHHIVSLTGNATLANPTTETAGQSGSIFVEQDGTGSRTLAYGNNFKWVGGTAPTLSTAANAVDRIDYIVRATDIIHCVISLDIK